MMLSAPNTRLKFSLHFLYDIFSKNDNYRSCESGSMLTDRQKHQFDTQTKMVKNWIHLVVMSVFAWMSLAQEFVVALLLALCFWLFLVGATQNCQCKRIARILQDLLHRPLLQVRSPPLQFPKRKKNATREKTGKSSGIWTISLEIFRCKIVESFFKANRNGSLESVSIERPEAVAWMLIYRGLGLRSKLPGEQILVNSQQLASWWFVLPLPSTSS